jgi:hypothetical protein
MGTPGPSGFGVSPGQGTNNPNSGTGGSPGQGPNNPNPFNPGLYKDTPAYKQKRRDIINKFQFIKNSDKSMNEWLKYHNNIKNYSKVRVEIELELIKNHIKNLDNLQTDYEIDKHIKNLNLYYYKYFSKIKRGYAKKVLTYDEWIKTDHK